MDVLAVHQETKYAKEWTDAGKGPLVLEVETYRYGGHSMSDPGTTYRTRRNTKVRAKNDSITKLKEFLFEYKVLTEDEIKTLDMKARAKFDSETEEAQDGAKPDLSEFSTNVYAKGNEVPFVTKNQSS